MIESRELVVLTKVPAPGQVKTRLGQAIGMEAAAGLACALLRDVLSGAAEAIVPADRLVVCHAPDGAPPAWFVDLVRESAPRAALRPQGPGDLGTRLRRALAGSGPRLALGSDLPDLPAAALRDALDTLRAHDLVLGPAEDGGYYLLGLGAGVSAEPLADGIRWSHAQTRADTQAAFARAGVDGARLLEPRRDVDDLPALVALEARLARRPPSLAPATRAWLAEHRGSWPLNPGQSPV